MCAISSVSSPRNAVSNASRHRENREFPDAHRDAREEPQLRCARSSAAAAAGCRLRAFTFSGRSSVARATDRAVTPSGVPSRRALDAPERSGATGRDASSFPRLGNERPRLRRGKGPGRQCESTSTAGCPSRSFSRRGNGGSGRSGGLSSPRGPHSRRVAPGRRDARRARPRGGRRGSRGYDGESDAERVSCLWRGLFAARLVYLGYISHM